MKKKFVILFFLILTTSICKSQNLDSLSNDVKLLKGGIIYMRNNLNEAHKEFKTGTTFFFSGLAIVGIGAVMPANSDKRAEEIQALKNGLVIGGSVICLIGSIIMIDSHKFIGRAGRWQFEGNTIKYDF